jgi:hypothetical protein
VECVHILNYRLKIKARFISHLLMLDFILLKNLCLKILAECLLRLKFLLMISISRRFMLILRYLSLSHMKVIKLKSLLYLCKRRSIKYKYLFIYIILLILLNKTLASIYQVLYIYFNHIIISYYYFYYYDIIQKITIMI